MTGLRAGLLVGGRGRRLGGVTKALLPHPHGGTLLSHWRDRFARLGVPWVAAGAAEGIPPEIPTLADAPPGIGPLGALRALCAQGDGPLLVFACDMPFVPDALVMRLIEHPPAAAVMPRREGRWEPLCGRYDPRVVREVIDGQIAARKTSLQALCDLVGATELAWDHPEALDDWDTPDDLARPRA